MRAIGHSIRLLALLCLAAEAGAQTPRERPAERWSAQADAAQPVRLPAGAALMRDLAYGSDPAQRLDVYAPHAAHGAPVLVMVHGGAWKVGDKQGRGIVVNKLAHWMPQGWLFVSINYRMLPAQDALAQADDVARALAFVQAHADTWGGDPARVVLMGHSAGAHLVALLSAAPAKAYALGAKPWLGTVALDSATMDVAQVMQRRHFAFYDEAFGADPARWRAASPLDSLSPDARPLLAVCSTIRRDDPCANAQRYVDAAHRLGRDARLAPQALSHAQINRELGLPGSYTESVDAFIASLDPKLAALASARRDARP